MTDDLTCEVVEGHILVITLNRPPVNALTMTTYEAMVDVFQSLESRDEIRVVVLTAAGKVFCGGQDVNEIVHHSAEDTLLRRSLLRKALDLIYHCPVPLIAAVNGPAVGAGCIMISCADVVIATENAFFSLPEIDIGIVGGGKHMSRILPLSKARYMALTGARITAEEFYRLGAVEKVVKPEQLMGEAMNIARQMAAKSPLLLQKWKHSFLETESMSAMDGFAYEQKLTQELSSLPEVRRAAQGFFEKK